MHVTPYLCFEGHCQEAVEFYQQAVGAQVLMMMKFGEVPDCSGEGCSGGAPMNPDKIAHCAIKIGETELHLSDGMNSGKAAFAGITLSISADNDKQVKERFEALSEGGQVLMPLAPSFFASSWGVCADKFGVNWMVLAPIPVAAA